jgi:hypothetical protein
VPTYKFPVPGGDYVSQSFDRELSQEEQTRIHTQILESKARESQGPIQRVVGPVNEALSGARDATQGFINRTIRNLNTTGTPTHGGGTSGPFTAEEVGLPGPANLVAGMVNPVPGNIPEAATLGAQVATAPLSWGARLAIPPAVSGVSSLLTGETPMQAAQRAGVTMGGQIAGEGTGLVGNWTARKINQRTTTGASESAMGREAQAIGAGMADILPYETAPFLKQGGTPDELLRMRDPNALRQQLSLGKQLADQDVVSALKGRTYLVGDQPMDASGALGALKELKAEVREMQRAKRIGTTEYNPLAARDFKEKAAQAEALERNIRRDLDAIGAPQVRENYDAANKAFGDGMDLLDFLEAAQKKTGTTGQTFASAEDLRKYLMQNRQYYPESTHGPLFDRIQLGRGDTPGSIEVPNVIPWVAPVGTKLNTLGRVGAPEPAQVPPALLDILFGRLLNSFNPQGQPGR